MIRNIFSPYWWAPAAQPAPRPQGVPVYRLVTSGVEVDDDMVCYGVNPVIYRQLPDECIVLLTISADVPDDGESLPVAIAVPCAGTSTVGQGTVRTAVVDSKGDAVTGSGIKGGTERLVFISKSRGVIRFLEFVNS